MASDDAHSAKLAIFFTKCKCIEFAMFRKTSDRVAENPYHISTLADELGCEKYWERGLTNQADCLPGERQMVRTKEVSKNRAQLPRKNGS